MDYTVTNQATKCKRLGHLGANFVALNFRTVCSGTEVVPSSLDLIHRADDDIVAIDLVVEAQQITTVYQDAFASHDFLGGLEI